MTDENEHGETEARLRAALSARAESVQPSLGDPAAAVAAGARTRRTRTFLAAAAVVALVAGVAGAAVLLADDDGAEEVASGPETTTTTVTAPIEGSGAPVIWPLPTMSLQYESAEQAAEAFMEQYIGIETTCDAPADERSLTPCRPPSPPCPSTASNCGRAGTSLVQVEQRGLGWVVLGAESNLFDVTTPQAGAVVGANITVDTSGIAAEATAVAELRPLGTPPGTSPTVDTNTVPLGVDGSWHLILGAADGPTVLIVHDGASATARVITVDSSAFPPETTTTTTGPTDDGTVGWPGNTSRHFDDAYSAAIAFVTEMLDFADPVSTGGNSGEADASIGFLPRPTAGIETGVMVHDTGTARGWVVVGVQSDQGTIESVSRDGDNITVTGVATAFEATVDIRLVDAEGDVLGETIAMAGSNGELGPFTAVVRQDVASDSPIYVQIAEGDSSGEGRFVWATWSPPLAT